MTNLEVAKAFAAGATHGHSGTMRIEGDCLLSYRSCIAKRQGTTLFVSNKARFLGGMPYSMTTSQHISTLLSCLPKTNVYLVNGWVT